jgi:toxin ParE1/3/4
VVDVFISAQADVDLEDIWHRIAEENPRAADRLLRRIAERIGMLAEFPLIGAPRPQLSPKARILSVGKYVVLYEPVPDGIEVRRVLHGARNLPEIY